MSTTTEPLFLIKLRSKAEHAQEHNQPFLNITPDFQREYEAWDEKMRTRLIESILLGRVMNPIWVIVTEEGNEEVLDGMHRLTTLINFLENRTTIGHIRYYEELRNKKFKDLPPPIQNKIHNYNVNINRLDSSYRSDPDKLMEMWEILNKSSKPLNTYELEKPIRKPVYDLVERFHPLFEKSVLFKKGKSSRGSLTMIILQMLAFTEPTVPSSSSIPGIMDSWFKRRFGETRLAVEGNLDHAQKTWLEKTCRRLSAYMLDLTERNVFDGQKTNTLPKIVIARCVAGVEDVGVWKANVDTLAERLKAYLGEEHGNMMLSPRNGSSFHKKAVEDIDSILSTTV